MSNKESLLQKSGISFKVILEPTNSAPGYVFPVTSGERLLIADYAIKNQERVRTVGTLSEILNRKFSHKELQNAEMAYQTRLSKAPVTADRQSSYKPRRFELARRRSLKGERGKPNEIFVPPTFR